VVTSKVWSSERDLLGANLTKEDLCQSLNRMKKQKNLQGWIVFLVSSLRKSDFLLVGVCYVYEMSNTTRMGALQNQGMIKLIRKNVDKDTIGA